MPYRPEVCFACERPSMRVGRGARGPRRDPGAAGAGAGGTGRRRATAGGAARARLEAQVAALAARLGTTRRWGSWSRPSPMVPMAASMQPCTRQAWMFPWPWSNAKHGVSR